MNRLGGDGWTNDRENIIYNKGYDGGDGVGRG